MMPSRFRELAPAKLNLTLSIVGRRADGYHLIESLVAFCDWGDVVSLEVKPGFEFRSQGRFASEITSENLIVKTANMLRDKFGMDDLGDVLLEKMIPVAAGVGGGSGDAAALLRIVREMKPELFKEIDPATAFAELGADVPVCFAGHAAWMEGIGERIRPVDGLPLFHVVLVNPLKQVLTAEVFERYRRLPGLRAGDYAKDALGEIQFNSLEDLTDFMELRGNDLTEAACSVLPEISDVLGALEQSDHCLIAAMSGSGATCFAVFAEKSQAEWVAERLAVTHEKWWVQVASVGC